MAFQADAFQLNAFQIDAAITNTQVLQRPVDFWMTEFRGKMRRIGETKEIIRAKSPATARASGVIQLTRGKGGFTTRTDNRGFD